MSKELTVADLADYEIEISTGNAVTETRHVHAAYVTTSDDRWVVLKDHEHTTVAQFNASTVLMVRRMEPQAAA